MSERVRKTDFKSLFKAFLGMDEEDYQQDNLSEEEAIKKCNEITEQQKEDLLKEVTNRAKLEAMLKYSSKDVKGKKTKSRLKISENGDNKEKNQIQEISDKDISRDDR